MIFICVPTSASTGAHGDFRHRHGVIQHLPKCTTERRFSAALHQLAEAKSITREDITLLSMYRSQQYRMDTRSEFSKHFIILFSTSLTLIARYVHDLQPSHTKSTLIAPRTGNFQQPMFPPPARALGPPRLIPQCTARTINNKSPDPHATQKFRFLSTKPSRRPASIPSQGT
jgi:hypothetical protein